MGYYYSDPSGLGAWYVPDGSSPADAFQAVKDATGATFSPLLEFSVANNTAAQQVGGGKPDLPPTPLPKISIKANHPKIISDIPFGCDPTQETLVTGGDCVPSGPFGANVCPDGWSYDAYNDVCVPVDTGTGSGIPGGGSPGATSSGSGSVQVTVNNAVELSTGVGQSIADAVSAGIKNATDLATQAASDAAQAVTKAVGDLATGVKSTLDSIIGGVKDALTYISNLLSGAVGKLIDFITTNLSKVITDIRDTLVSVIKPIADTVTSVANEVQSINDTLIKPIANAINTTINTVSTLTVAIESDLHEGLAGILQIPGDVAAGLTSLDATLNRTVQQLGSANKDVVDVNLKNAMDTAIGSHLDNLSKILGGKDVSALNWTTFSDSVALSEPDIASAGAASFGAIWRAITTFIGDLFSSGKPSIDAFKTLPIAFPLILGEAVTVPVFITGLILAMVESMQPLLDFIKEDIRAKSGLSKLDAPTALQAWVRGFVSADNLAEELAVNGWDAGRQKVLRDLQTALFDVATAMDMFFRGIISEADLRLNLVGHGIVTNDQDALIKAANKVIDPGLALKAWRFGVINEEDAKTVLRTNRYTEDEIGLTFDTALQPEGVTDVIERHKRESLVSNHLLLDPIFGDIPGDVVEAARRDGFDSARAADAWRNQYEVPGIDHWLNLYFRGIRTHTELLAAMDYFRVPQDWRDDYIRARQSLIPFRTIPTMLSSGIVTEAYAREILTAHGFDLTAVNALIAYAGIHKATAKATSASALKSLSIASAKTFWLDGAITEQQYRDVLASHGEAVDAIDITVKVEKLEATAKARKQTGDDIVNEVLAGFITLDQAKTQFAANSFTQAEQAKYLKSIARVQKATSKTPPEAELTKMVKGGVIAVQDYLDALGVLGYSQKWVTAIAALNKVG